MGNEPNPYSPPAETDEPALRAKCPACGHSVGRLRYMIPFGRCPGCGNYLTVSNAAANYPLRNMIAFGIIFLGYALDWLGLVPHEDYPDLTLLFGYLVLGMAYDKAVGTLVLAKWRGLFAVDDDEHPDRLDEDSPA